MYKIWLQIEEMDEDGEPSGDRMEPIDVVNFHDLADAEAFIDRVLRIDDEPPDAVESATVTVPCLTLPRPTPGTAHSEPDEQDSAEHPARESRTPHP